MLRRDPGLTKKVEDVGKRWDIEDPANHGRI